MIYSLSVQISFYRKCSFVRVEVCAGYKQVRSICKNAVLVGNRVMCVWTTCPELLHETKHPAVDFL